MPTFGRNMSLPSSGKKNKASKNPALSRYHGELFITIVLRTINLT
jgi:hypothetical protein